ncbi:MAG: hypothetical protein NVS4B3_12620 [Gemmatimonadaceae bacterium]
MVDSPRKLALQSALQEVFELFAKDVERNVKRRLDQSSQSGTDEAVRSSTIAAIARLADLLSRDG